MPSNSTKPDTTDKGKKAKTPKKRAARKPSQTAQILANVEALLELHENPDKPNEGFEEVLEQIKSLKQDSAQLHERTEQLVKQLEDGQPKQSNNENVLERLENSNYEIFETLDKKIATKINALDARISELAKSGSEPSNGDNSTKEDISELISKQTQAFESKLEERLECLDSRISKIAEKIEESIDLQTSLVENSETPELKQLSDSFDRYNREVNQSTESTYVALTENINDSFSILTKQIEQLANSIESNPLKQNQNSTSSRASEQFESNTTMIIESNENFCSRFEAFDHRLAKITDAIEGQQSLIELVRRESPNTEEINNKTDIIVGTFKNQVDDLFESVGSRIARFSEFLARQEIDIDNNYNNELEPELVTDHASDEETSTSSYWERQKAAMLSKYGIDPEHRPSNELPTPKKPSVEETPFKLDETNVSENLEKLRDPLDSIVAEDAEAIVKLKDDLTAKLREAEVELSINRARISQQKAELEAKQVEIERFEQSLKKKSSDRMAKEIVNSTGILDRMKRHLGLSNSDIR